MTTSPLKIAEPLSLLDTLEELQQAYLAETTPEIRKARGQFFTPWPIANFMAEALDLSEGPLRILDPGAGAGALSVAVCERLLKEPAGRLVHFDLFDTDKDVIAYLDQVMSECQSAMSLAGHSMTYKICSEDFVLTMAPCLGLSQEETPTYDAVIANPPYFKINKASPYSSAIPEIIHGQPNIYAIFLAVATSCLKEGGSLVSITPRSFCNGLYFRAFRKWFLDRMALDQIHLFRSRTNTFREAKVLQESVITVATKQSKRNKSITVSRSDDREFQSLQEQNLSAEQVVSKSDPDRFIYLPETNQDAEIVKYAQQWKFPFEEQGLRISTGPVVMFRAKEFLLEDETKGVPLLSAHNIRQFQTVWPITKAKWPVAFADTEDSRKHLLPTRNYVLLKRFSSKEERRRLTAGCLFAKDQNYERLAIENHLNYIYHTERELTDQETRGVAAIFNSVFFDRYFRTLSGNTQVNATEIRTLHFPSLELIARIGERICNADGLDPVQSEHIVLEELGVNGSLRSYLESVAT